ncbi:SH3 domain-containing protein [uncultured Maritimibacter sp.]|uniref:SH3 domain-containing protein n=1 Tax=uncultured Maritimibacter sp. TaxID=991866 RepID=UPI002688DAD4|tara:strand:+ start:9145 stop:10125 length:981 start_codon:yes stop_codon:yes gene_type:complete
MKLLTNLPDLQALHRSHVRFSALLATFALLLSAMAAEAQDIRTERISFSTGTSGTVIRGEIVGDEIIDYVLGASGGQRMVVDLAVDNPSAYFNLLPAGDPAAIHVGNVSGNHFDDILPSSGDWVIRVYLMRNAARRDERTDFSLSVHIGGTGHSVQAPDFADGDAGGPDFWQVTGVSGGDHLNVRSGPSTQYSIIGRVANGQILRNFGCRGRGNDRWCEVEHAAGGLRGWVAGRYLRESAAPGAATAPAPTGNASSASGTDVAAEACRRALATQANRPTSDIAIAEVLEAEAGIGVTMTMAGADRPWSCMSDAAGNVKGLMYMGEG